MPTDPVSITVGSALRCPHRPKDTNSEGQATFEVPVPAGYYYPGDSIPVTASDTKGLSLGPVTEYMGEIDFLGKSFVGQTDTLQVVGLGGSATEHKSVTLQLGDSSVALSGTCTTDGTGSLPAEGATDACTFTVPTFPDVTPPAAVTAVVTVGSQVYDETFILEPPPTIHLTPTSGLAVHGLDQWDRIRHGHRDRRDLHPGRGVYGDGVDQVHNRR